MIKNISEEIYQELANKYSKEEWKQKFIVLFGMNTPAQVEVNYFLKNNLSVAAIVDNDIDKQGKYYRNILISPPKEILGKYREDAVIIIASSAYDSMKKELEQMGYRENIEMQRLKSFTPVIPDSLTRKKSPEYKEMTLQEIQLKITQILIYVRDFCVKHNLRYFIAAGSLLGAVRHQGFIPWDDDIDIFMPFPDYLKFCELFQNDKKYELSSMHNTTLKSPSIFHVPKVLAKDTYTLLNRFPLFVEGNIGVDIFPMSGYPDTADERKKYAIHLEHLFRDWADNVLIPMKTPDYDKAAHQACYDKILKEMTRYPYDSSSYVGNVVISPLKRFIAPKSYYDNTVK